MYSYFFPIIGRSSYAINTTESSGGNKNVGQNNHNIDNSEEGSSSKTIGKRSNERRVEHIILLKTT